VLSGAAIMATCLHANAQLPPVVRLIVGYPPGGSVDYLARTLAEPLQQALKTTVIVENRPGAGGRIAAFYLKNAPADGSVIMVAPNALITLQSLIYAGTLNYNVSEDFTPVSKLTSYPLAVAVPASLPVKNIADLKTWLKAHPAEASFGSSGAGGLSHFSGLLLGKAMGVTWTHAPYKGGAPLINDLAGGHIPAGIDTVIDQIPHHRGGKIRILATLTSERYPLATDLPSLGEQGIRDLNIEGWVGLYVSSKVPSNIAEQIDQATAKVLASPAFTEKLNKQLIQVTYQPGREFRKQQDEDFKLWAPVLKASGFKPE